MNMDLNSMRVLKKEKDHREIEVRVLVVAVASMMPKLPQAKERAALSKGGQDGFWSQAVVKADVRQPSVVLSCPVLFSPFLEIFHSFLSRKNTPDPPPAIGPSLRPCSHASTHLIT